MDLLDVISPFFDFLYKFLAVNITLGGYTFSVGALWLWVIIGCLLIAFLKGLAK